MDDTVENTIIRGDVILPNAELSIQLAEVIVQVEDVSRADAPSVVVGEQRQTGVALRSGALIPFVIEVPAGLVEERHRYSVRVHIDVSGSGKVDVGDFVSTQSYPVLTSGTDNDVQIKVVRV